jgi:hypothetical protein
MEGTVLKLKAGVHPQCICLGVLILAAVVRPDVESVDWVVGIDLWINGPAPYIGRYNTWLVGPPRMLMVEWNSDFTESNLGDICSVNWERYAAPGNSQDRDYTVKCGPSPSYITANSDNLDSFVGTLTQDGVAIASCYKVEHHYNKACDSDLGAPR